MADPSSSATPPLTPSSIKSAHARIEKYIHRTPLVTSQTLDRIASSTDPKLHLTDDPPPLDDDTNNTTTPNTSPTSFSNGVHPNPSTTNPPPRFRLFFKLENLQKIGAFKARGAFHALTRLIESTPGGFDEVRRRGVVTHSSGNHAQALALAARTFGVPAWIVMPGISTKSKIAGTRMYAGKENVVFSGSTSQERESVVRGIMEEKGCFLVPPYDHVDIILGQGTVGLEMEEQVCELKLKWEGKGKGNGKGFDAVIAPIGGGGLLGGIATWFADSPGTKVFGAEPSFEGADDAKRGVERGKRIETVNTLTIADGLRTPVGMVNWGIVSDRGKVEGFYSVTEEQIKATMRLVFERMKFVVEPSGCVALAVVLWNEEFREMVRKKQMEEVEGGEEGCWDIGVVFSGGNTTMEAIAGIFGEEKGVGREMGQVGVNGVRMAENVAG